MQTPAPGIHRDHEVLTRRFMITEDYRPSAVQPSAITDACRPAPVGRWRAAHDRRRRPGVPAPASAVIMSGTLLSQAGVAAAVACWRSFPPGFWASFLELRRGGGISAPFQC